MDEKRDDEISKDTLKYLLKKNAILFWSVSPEKIEDLPLESLVEAVLNYGNMEQLRELFSEVGEERVAAIFREQIKRARKVYLPMVENYFRLYFDKYVPLKCQDHNK